MHLFKVLGDICKHLLSSFQYLFCSYSINHRIKHRRDDHVEVGQQDVDIAWDAFPTKPVGKDREESRNIEQQNDTDMGSTSTQGLGLGFLGREAEYRSEDVDIGNSNENDVQACREKSSCQPIPDINGNVRAGQPGNTHVLTKCVCNDVDPAVVQPLEEKDGWEHDYKTACQGSSSDLPHDLSRQDGGVAQRRAYCHIAVKSHGQQDSRVSHEEEVDEEHLSQAAIKGDVART